MVWKTNFDRYLDDGILVDCPENHRKDRQVEVKPFRNKRNQNCPKNKLVDQPQFKTIQNLPVPDLNVNLIVFN